MNTLTLINKIKDDAILNNLSSFFNNQIYLVGGSVRDCYLEKETHDRDIIIIDENAKDFALKVSNFFEGKFIPLDEINNIYRIVLPNKIDYIDITNPINNSLQEDILRRDLTINAIAIDIKTGEIPTICTPFFSDLENKIIRGINEENFVDDPLRLLRVFRFYSLLGFNIDSKTLNYVKKHVNLIHKPAKERVQYELMKLFSGEFADLALLKMNEVGILEEIFPFVKELKQVPPNLHHHLDLFNHSIETIKQVELLYKNSSEDVKTHMNKVDFGGFSRLAHLKLACFMHDIGKFSTWSIDEDGRHRFIKHDEVGAKMCPKILKNLCFSNKQVDYISYIVKKHMYPTAVVSAPEVNEKVMLRYIRKSEDNAIDNILIAQADRLSAQGPEITTEIVTENLNALNKLLEFYLKTKETIKPLPKLIDGNEIMKILNIKPSKILGKLIEQLKEAQISNEITTKEEAINFIKEEYLKLK